MTLPHVSPYPGPVPGAARSLAAEVPAAAAPAGERAEELRSTAVRFEAAFLAEMLRHSGLGAARSAFGGGAGEKAFSGSLIEAYAVRIAESGGLGLADNIFAALVARENP